VTDQELAQAVEKAIAQALEQGFPRLIEDERILDKLAVLSLPERDSDHK
jgi:hypothetical protein